MRPPHQGNRPSTEHRSRRKLLVGLAGLASATAAGWRLPDQWIRPVVNSVVLPAHAVTSPETQYFGLSLSRTRVSDPDDGGGTSPVHACVIVSGSSATVTLQGAENIARRSGDIPLDGTAGVLESVGQDSSCPWDSTPPGFPPTQSASVENLSGESVTLRVSRQLHWEDGEFDDPPAFLLTIPAASCGGFPDLDGCED